MLYGNFFPREVSLDELKERARKATVSSKSIINPALWAVSTVFFILLPYCVWQTTKNTEFTVFYVGTYITMIFVVWIGKKFVSVTFLKWYLAWHGLQLEKEMYNKLYFFSIRKYNISKKEAEKWAKETQENYDTSSILEFIEHEERRKHE